MVARDRCFLRFSSDAVRFHLLLFYGDMCLSSSVHIFDAWLHLQHQGADAVQQLQEQVTGWGGERLPAGGHQKGAHAGSGRPFLLRLIQPHKFVGVLCADGDRQRRRPDRGISVRGGPPDGAHLKAGLLQAPRTGREEGQQTHHQGRRGEWRGELDATHRDAHETKKKKLWHVWRELLVDCFASCHLWFYFQR